MFGGKMGGGFGAPGVRESKTSNDTTENDIPTEQTLRIAFGTAIVLFSVYIVLKIFITSRDDWALLLGILSVPGIPTLIILLDRMLKREVPHFYAGIYRSVNRVIMGDNLALFIVCGVPVASIALVMLWFYIKVIIPQATLTLDREAHYVAFICVVIGLLVAYKPFHTFFSRQLTDSLRDSDSGYAQKALEFENEWRKIRAGVIEGEFTVAEPKEVEVVREPPTMVFGNIERTQIAPPKNLHRTAMADFLDGIRDRKWDTSERSWKDKRLPNARISLTAIGDELRDSLIAANWAEWNHPTKPSQGWDLMHDPETTKNGYLNGTTNGVINEDYGGTTGQDSEGISEDADRGS